MNLDHNYYFLKFVNKVNFWRAQIDCGVKLNKTLFTAAVNDINDVESTYV